MLYMCRGKINWLVVTYHIFSSYISFFILIPFSAKRLKCLKLAIIAIIGFYVANIEQNNVVVITCKCISMLITLPDMVNTLKE